MDYSEILIRIREETLRAQRAFLAKKIGQAEVCSLELLRLSVKLLDVAEEFTDAQTRESAGKRRAA